jgi:hypothetical protein
MQASREIAQLGLARERCFPLTQCYRWDRYESVDEEESRHVQGLFCPLGVNLIWHGRIETGRHAVRMLRLALVGLLVLVPVLIYGAIAQARFGDQRVAVFLAIVAFLIAGLCSWLLISN